MRTHYRIFSSCLVLTSAFVCSTIAKAAGPTTKAPRSNAKIAVDRAPRDVSLIEGARAGTIDVVAQGRGDGKMNLTITNRSRETLKVVLPPGLIASGATGQFAGVGGMGGGANPFMGGGGNGAGAGGFGGGGMNGMNGMNGNGANNRGGMNNGMSQGATTSASMGMVMVGRLIMNVVGERNTWNYRSLNAGGMGGVGVGGGAGGGLGANGFGNGFRSVPPTGTPFATISPGQTRELPTSLISLDSPRSAQSSAPFSGERLVLDDMTHINASPRTQAALEALAQSKAPITIAQLAIWNVSNEMDWPTIARVSKGWANTHELTLAKSFVESLGRRDSALDGPRLFFEVTSKTQKSQASADALTKTLKDHSYLGLKTSQTIPGKPMIPSLSCRVEVLGNTAEVTLAQSNADATAWVKPTHFSLDLTQDDRQDDSFAREILARLITSRIVAGSKIKGKPSYRIEIQNSSPLVLNSVALGVENATDSGKNPTLYQAIALSPERKFSFPIAEADHQSTQVIAVDLGGL